VGVTDTMAKQKAFFNDLKKHFKLNIYEVKIWTSLLSRGIASAGELADISGVPRSRCYDVLESLEKKGFIIMKIGKPIKYIAVKPEVILERTKKNHEESAVSQMESLDKIAETDAFKELELLHKSGIQRVDITDISKSVVGRSSINRHIKQMLRSADSKVLVVTNQHGAEKNLKSVKAVVPELKKKKVDVKVYAPHDKKILKKLQGVDIVEHNGESSFVSVDNKELLFIVTSSSVVPEYEVAVWINSPFFVNALNVLFEAGMKG